LNLNNYWCDFNNA